MTVIYGNKKRKQSNIFYTIIVAILFCFIFVSTVGFLYIEAEKDSREMLHVQTKQIKDDITMQMLSDNENLVTMSHFAAKLYSDGESYDRMFASFEPSGLISNIGILNPDNTFLTKVGKVDLSGKISFEEEAQKGNYISGRVPDLTLDNYEIIRSAAPIVVGGEAVGILYGVIKINAINEKYSMMADDIDAQLFVYDKQSGKFVIDTINDYPKSIEVFKDRKYQKGYSYELLTGTDKGYTAFKSIFSDEDMYVHYSTLDGIDWGIMLARYESQVFEKMDRISRVLFISFIVIAFLIVCYILYIIRNEKSRTQLLSTASKTRKILLEIDKNGGNISEGIKNVMNFTKSRSAFLVDADGEDYLEYKPEFEELMLDMGDKNAFILNLFRNAAKSYKKTKNTVGVVSLKRDKVLYETNKDFYEMLEAHKIDEVSCAFVIDKNNYICILGIVNPKQRSNAKNLLEDVAVCFSIALHNKKYLNRTEAAATTDSLTGANNRVAYKHDIIGFDKEMPEEFACIYVDVNELHSCNNKYGHSMGDQMLIYIANTLKEVFFGQHIYRMGGDEFLVFVKGATVSEIDALVDSFRDSLKQKDYNVAIGISYRKKSTSCEELVTEAEVRMYEAKAEYYQSKELERRKSIEGQEYVQTKTGILEIDTMISVLKDHYNGIYRVSLETDKAHRILMPSYLGYKEHEEKFSGLVRSYVADMVQSDYQRAVLNFINYTALKKQIAEGKIPRITYKKIDGETVILSVYRLGDDDGLDDTLWVFAKD